MQNRKQLYIARGYRAVWTEAEQVAATEEMPISTLVSEAIAAFLKRRRRVLAGKADKDA